MEELKEKIKNHFEAHFHKPMFNRLSLDGLSFNNISSEDNLGLELSFSEEEVRDVT